MDSEKTDLLSVAEGLMTNHLGFLPTYLKRLFPHIEFSLTDSRGQNSLFWLEEGSCFSVNKNLTPTPQQMNRPEYLEEERTLLFPIAKDDISFFLKATGVNSRDAKRVAERIDSLMPALVRYISLYQLATENLTSLVLPFYTHFFSAQSFDVERFFSLTHDYLDPAKKYYVVARSFDPGNELSPHQLTNIAHSLVRDKSTKIFNFIYENQSLMVVSVDNDYHPDDYRSYRMSVRIVHERTRGELRSPCKIQTGIGRPKTVNDLFNSYKEARCAQAFGMQAGKDDFTLAFGDLGGIEAVLEKSPRRMVSYCAKTLGGLLNRETGALRNELFDTVRVFLESNMQYKKAADALYIHPNTLRYRINKAYEIMGRNPESMDDHAIVHLAIKTWCILRQCDYFGLDSKEVEKIRR